MFPESAFEGMYKTVNVLRKDTTTFSKGKQSSVYVMVVEQEQMVIKPVSLGKVLKVMPDADRMATYFKFYRNTDSSVAPIQPADIFQLPDGQLFGVTSAIDWTSIGNFQSGFITVETKIKDVSVYDYVFGEEFDEVFG